MKSSFMKLTLFVLFTAAFVSGLVAFSKSRGYEKPMDEMSEEENYSFNNDEQNKRYEKQFTVTEGGTLIVEADEGTIKINSWDKNEVNVVVEVDTTIKRREIFFIFVPVVIIFCFSWHKNQH